MVNRPLLRASYKFDRVEHAVPHMCVDFSGDETLTRHAAAGKLVKAFRVRPKLADVPSCERPVCSELAEPGREGVEGCGEREEMRLFLDAQESRKGKLGRYTCNCHAIRSRHTNESHLGLSPDNFRDAWTLTPHSAGFTALVSPHSAIPLLHGHTTPRAHTKESHFYAT